MFGNSCLRLFSNPMQVILLLVTIFLQDTSFTSNTSLTQAVYKTGKIIATKNVSNIRIALMSKEFSHEGC